MENKDKKNRRKNQRRYLKKDAVVAYVEIPLLIPKETLIKKEVLDISKDGLSFLIPEDEGNFLVNT
ncbi:MAG: hypothetical protein V1872_14715, partial [bacterium]